MDMKVMKNIEKAHLWHSLKQRVKSFLNQLRGIFTVFLTLKFPRHLHLLM
jgi:hypothetical protein